MNRLPRPRGPLTRRVLRLLSDPSTGSPDAAPVVVSDPLGDDDLHLALYLCYELSYRGLPGVDDELEWDPALVAMRRELERPFETALRSLTRPPAPGRPEDVDLALRELIAADEAPPLSRHLQVDGTFEQVREFMVHRSAYQLKESDPHSFAIPRLSGPPKAALVEIQADEYGNGRADRIHAALFARAMAAVGLDPRYGAYLELLPGVTLATVNLMSMFGLRRSLRGAIVGHLACFEMTSTVPNRRYGDALRRLGAGPEATHFFDEHVEADSVHENLAAVDLAGGLAREEPALAGDIMWGAAALLELEGRWARRLLGAWAEGRSSLLDNERMDAPAEANGRRRPVGTP
jgi:hypothetical protein